MAPATTINDESLKNSIIASAVLHIIILLFLYFGLPHLMPPLPQDHVPVPFEIVEISELTNTRVKEEEPKPQPPAPEPPKPEVKQELKPPPPPTPPPPAEKPPEPQVEALKPIPAPKPKPPEPQKQTNDDFAKLLKNLETKKQPPAPKAETKTEAKPQTQSQPASAQASPLSSRLTISEEDALRRQISQCWNAPVGARDAQNLIVEVMIDVNPDRTVANAEIVDKGRYASDSFFRAAADSAKRAVLNPKCSPLELPEGKYDQWKRIDFTFDPRDML